MSRIEIATWGYTTCSNTPNWLSFDFCALAHRRPRRPNSFWGHRWESMPTINGYNHLSIMIWIGLMDAKYCCAYQWLNMETYLNIAEYVTYHEWLWVMVKSISSDWLPSRLQNLEVWPIPACVIPAVVDSQTPCFALKINLWMEEILPRLGWKPINNGIFAAVFNWCSFSSTVSMERCWYVGNYVQMHQMFNNYGHNSLNAMELCLWKYASNVPPILGFLDCRTDHSLTPQTSIARSRISQRSWSDCMNQ